jgi:peptide deformylase
VPKLLRLTRFGNPILRQKARELSIDEIKSSMIQQLIADIRYTNQKKEYGMGIAAPQVGESLALSVIGIKPTPTRPNLDIFEQVIINPVYEGISRRAGMWEGCQSGGEADNILYAKSLRFKKIHATWYDEHAVFHDEELSGFVAHVFQHETDHLNGILFVDRVRDTKTYMMADEYRKRIVKGKETR